MNHAFMQHEYEAVLVLLPTVVATIASCWSTRFAATRAGSLIAMVAAGALAGGCTRPDDRGSEKPATSASSQSGGKPGERLVRVNEFLSYSPAAHVLWLRLVTGYTDINNTLNFNGATEGAHMVSVPVGWRVEAVVENRADLPHSAVVLTSTATLPTAPTIPAFSGAHTTDAASGAGAMTSRTLAFIADRAGSYQIVCGVPYHSQAGMWMGLVVSDTATVPAYTVRPDTIRLSP
jgi:sulfocyanin